MEALAAIGLASAIVQFVDFSSKLVTGASEIYSSTSGMPAAMGDCDVIIGNLRSLTGRLKVPLMHGSLSTEDKRLVALKDGCERLSDDLLAVIQTTKAKKPGSRLSSLKASWKGLRQRGKLASIESRLDRYRTEVLGQLLTMMRYLNFTFHIA